MHHSKHNIPNSNAFTEVTFFFIKLLKMFRLSQWFNRQKRRIISDLFERHQHLSIILKLLFQNRMKMAFHDVNSISGALKWTIISWLRTIWENTVSNAVKQDDCSMDEFVSAPLLPWKRAQIRVTVDITRRTKMHQWGFAFGSRFKYLLSYSN